MNQCITLTPDNETLIGYTKKYVDSLHLEIHILKETLRRIKGLANEVTGDIKTEEELLFLKLNEHIKSLSLDVRPHNCLLAENIFFVGDLVQRDEIFLLKTRDLGRKSLSNIKECLARKGLSLGYDTRGWTKPVS